MNAVEIEEAISKLAEQPFDPEEFYRETYKAGEQVWGGVVLPESFFEK
jgi:hypothetical protein